MSQEFIKDLIARTYRRGAGQPPKIPIIWKFLGEGKCTHFDLMFDRAETLARATEIGLRRRATYARTISDALNYKVELDSSPGLCRDTTRKPPAAHSYTPNRLRRNWILANTH